MKKVLVAYFSLAGHTQKMAEYIAEGVRFTGNQATVRKMLEIQKPDELNGYDGYIFGAPTYYLDMSEPVKTFLFLAKKSELAGKLGGAFGSYTHDGNAPRKIFDTMQYVFKMEPFYLGAFNLKEFELGTASTQEAFAESSDALRACQAYGKAFGEKLGN